MSPPVLVCDFDGTLTRADVGDALCDRFADPSWLEIDAMWVRGELTLPEAQRRMWGLVRASEAELIAHAREVGAFRDGADALFDAAGAGRIELVIASGGFDVYIEPLLGERREVVRAIYCNRLRAGDGRVELDFPHDDLRCTRCAVCKGEVVRRALAEGRRVAFCGDGSSDRCVAGVAPEVFAVRGGLLESTCRDRGVPCVAFDDLRDVVAALASEAA